MTECSRPGLSSRALYVRPRIGCSPRVGKNPAEVRKPSSRIGSPDPVRWKESLTNTPMSSNGWLLCVRSDTCFSPHGMYSEPRFTPGGDTSHGMTMCPASGYGRGFSKIAFTALKTAVLAPIPSASVRSATIVNPGAFRSTRTACRTSCAIVFTSISRLKGRERQSRIANSFVPQRHHGVDAHSAPRRNVCRKSSRDPHEANNRCEDREICCAHAVQQAAHEPRGRKCCNHSHSSAEPRKPQSLSDHEAEHIFPLRSQSEPDSYFAETLAHGVGKDTVNTEGRQQYSEAA